MLHDIVREQGGAQNGLQERILVLCFALKEIRDRPLDQSGRIDSRDPTEADQLLVHLDRSASDGEGLKNSNKSVV